MLRTILVACAAMTLATGANAATVSFNFGTIADTAAKTTGDLGQSATFIRSGLSVTASAFGPGFTTGPWWAPIHNADHLFGKGNGGDENGLGMTNDPSGDDEIYFGEGFIQLDLNALLGKVNPNAIFASFNSTTGGEQWTIFGSNTAGTIGSGNLPVHTFINSGINNEGANIQLTGGFRYYDFVSTVAEDCTSGGNVLLKSLTVTTAVPEPQSWALMIVGFGGLGSLLRRRRSRSQVAVAA